MMDPAFTRFVAHHARRATGDFSRPCLPQDEHWVLAYTLLHVAVAVETVSAGPSQIDALTALSRSISRLADQLADHR